MARGRSPEGGRGRPEDVRGTYKEPGIPYDEQQLRRADFVKSGEEKARQLALERARNVAKRQADPSSRTSQMQPADNSRSSGTLRAAAAPPARSFWRNLLSVPLDFWGTVFTPPKYSSHAETKASPDAVPLAESAPLPPPAAPIPKVPTQRAEEPPRSRVEVASPVAAVAAESSSQDLPSGRRRKSEAKESERQPATLEEVERFFRANFYDLFSRNFSWEDINARLEQEFKGRGVHWSVLSEEIGSSTEDIIRMRSEGLALEEAAKKARPVVARGVVTPENRFPYALVFSLTKDQGKGGTIPAFYAPLTVRLGVRKNLYEVYEKGSNQIIPEPLLSMQIDSIEGNPRGHLQEDGTFVMTQKGQLTAHD